MHYYIKFIELQKHYHLIIDKHYHLINWPEEHNQKYRLNASEYVAQVGYLKKFKHQWCTFWFEKYMTL